MENRKWEIEIGNWKRHLQETNDLLDGYNKTEEAFIFQSQFSNFHSLRSWIKQTSCLSAGASSAVLSPGPFRRAGRTFSSSNDFPMSAWPPARAIVASTIPEFIIRRIR